MRIFLLLLTLLVHNAYNSTIEQFDDLIKKSIEKILNNQTCDLPSLEKDIQRITPTLEKFQKVFHHFMEGIPPKKLAVYIRYSFDIMKGNESYQYLKEYCKKALLFLEKNFQSTATDDIINEFCGIIPNNFKHLISHQKINHKGKIRRYINKVKSNPPKFEEFINSISNILSIRERILLYEVEMQQFQIIKNFDSTLTAQVFTHNVCTLLCASKIHNILTARKKNEQTQKIETNEAINNSEENEKIQNNNQLSKNSSNKKPKRKNILQLFTHPVILK